MRVIVGKYPPREAGADDVWIATVTREVGRGRNAVGLGSSAWHMNPTAFLAISAIVARGGREITLAELRQHVYGDIPEGGAVARSIEAGICRARQHLMAAGIYIAHRYGWGYRLGCP